MENAVYSERRPVPTIQGYQQSRRDQRAADDARAADAAEAEAAAPANTTDNSKNTSASNDPATEKQELMNKMAGPKEKPTDKVKNRQGDHVVKDPTTGADITIKDAEFDDYPKPGETVATKPGNVHYYPYLPATPESFTGMLNNFEYLQLGLAISFGLIWFWFAFPSGRWWMPFSGPFFSLVFRSLVIGGMGFASTTCVSLIHRNIEKEINRVRVDMHRQRGQKFAPPTPESVEWLNSLTSVIWGLINPTMFTSIADMVEDILQQSLPGFVDAVRISDIGQGESPFRIISMRALPDKPNAKSEYEHGDWVNTETAGDQTGDYINMEIAFAYQAAPGKSAQKRAKNIHLLLEFFLGLYDWLHIPIPIWIQVDGIVGTIRLRVQFIPEAPFVREVTFSFMGVPGVDVSAIPMSHLLPNVLDLPMIARFVKMGIAAGTAEFVAPKSMTLNLQEMLNGAAIGDTRAQGVLFIVIHHAEGLSIQDRGGSSDPYIVVCYKDRRPAYSTRIILEDLNPVYEETTALLVTQDEIKGNDEVLLTLWDSDQRSADDLIGRVSIPVKELMNVKNTLTRRSDTLVGFEQGDKMDGKLDWSVGYFEKAPLKKELEKAPEEIPPPTKTAPAMEMRPGDKGPNPALKDLPPPPPDVQRTPPDPDYPSGILSVVIHQINNLERQNLVGTTGKEREGQAGQDTDEPSEQSENLPSAYCEIIVNDDMIFKTRVKQYTSMPFFEAGTERFIRDWRNTVVRLVVRDSRLREKDPILGVVNLTLAELLSEGSEVTRMFTISDGIGFGRMNASILFRGVKLELPHKQLGWDTGTVEILSPLVLSLNDASESVLRAQANKLVIGTTDSSETLPKKAASVDANQVTWDFSADQLRLPVYNRYSSSLTIEIGPSASVMGIGGGAQALGVLWLSDVADDEVTEVKIPIVVGKDLKQLRQNVLNEFAANTHDYQVVGHISTTIRLDRGLDEDHETHAKTQARRHAYETYDHVEGETVISERNAHAADDGHIDPEEKKALERAHKHQLANRQRGINGFKPFRTGKWMKEGLVNRVKPTKKSSKREPTVQSEV